MPVPSAAFILLEIIAHPIARREELRYLEQMTVYHAQPCLSVRLNRLVAKG